MRYYHHILTNMPKDASVLERILVNVMFFVTITRVIPRSPHLTQADRTASESLLRPGDIVLVGAHRRLFGLLVLRGIATHALICIAPGELVHAAADGVEKIRYAQLFDEYDTLVMCRPRGISDEQNELVLRYVDQMIGKPFDFFFARGERSFFCTELIESAFEAARYELRFTHHTKRYLLPHAHEPKDYLTADVDIVFTSHNLLQKDGNVVCNVKGGC
jgi:hypothetical protein